MNGSHPLFAEHDKWGQNQHDILADLLCRSGTVEYQAFDDVGEGHTLPTGLETMSWKVLTKDGVVRDYFLEWDPAGTAPDGSAGYYQIRCASYNVPVRDRHPGYVQARRKLGLTLTA